LADSEVVKALYVMIFVNYKDPEITTEGIKERYRQLGIMVTCVVRLHRLGYMIDEPVF